MVNLFNEGRSADASDSHSAAGGPFVISAQRPNSLRRPATGIPATRIQDRDHDLDAVPTCFRQPRFLSLCRAAVRGPRLASDRLRGRAGGGQCAGRAAAAAGHGRKARGQADRRGRRVRRPLRRGQRGRGAGPGRRLPREHRLRGRPDRQGRRPAVHHRRAPLRDRPRPGPGRAGRRRGGAELLSQRADPCRGADQPRQHLAAGKGRAARGLPLRTGPGRRRQGGDRAGQARSGVHPDPGTADRPDRPQLRLRGQPGRGQLHRADQHRQHRPDLLLLRHRRALLPGLRAQRAGARRPAAGRRWRAGRGDPPVRRQRGPLRRQAGLLREPAGSGQRHHAGAGPGAEPGPGAATRPLRPGQRARVAALRRHPAARRGDRQRPEQAHRLRGR